MNEHIILQKLNTLIELLQTKVTYKEFQDFREEYQRGQDRVSFGSLKSIIKKSHLVERVKRLEQDVTQIKTVLELV